MLHQVLSHHQHSPSSEKVGPVSRISLDVATRTTILWKYRGLCLSHVQCSQWLSWAPLMTHLVAAGHLFSEPVLKTDASDLARLLRLPSSARNPESLSSSSSIGHRSCQTFWWIESGPESTAVGVFLGHLTNSLTFVFYIIEGVFFHTVTISFP